MRESAAHPAQTTACFLHASSPSAAFQNTQLSISLGEACPAARVRQAWQQVTAHYGVLRSSFFKVPAGDFVYREHDGIEASWQLLDWTKLTRLRSKFIPRFGCLAAFAAPAHYAERSRTLP